MGILKKKKKEKKPWTTDRVVKIIMPLLLIVIVIVSCMEVYRSCDFPTETYTQMANELSKPYDPSAMMSDNKILDSDYSTMLEKLGSDGVDMPIFIDGRLTPALYDDKLFVDVLDSYSLTDCEMGAFCTTMMSVFTSLKVNMLELTLQAKGSMQWSMTSVYSLDVSELTNSVNNDTLKKIKTIYIKSVATIEMSGASVVLVDVSSQVNNLQGDVNFEALNWINSLSGHSKDACSELVIKIVNDMTTKTSTTLSLSDHSFGYIVTK